MRPGPTPTANIAPELPTESALRECTRRAASRLGRAVGPLHQTGVWLCHAPMSSGPGRDIAPVPTRVVPREPLALVLRGTRAFCIAIRADGRSMASKHWRIQSVGLYKPVPSKPDFTAHGARDPALLGRDAAPSSCCAPRTRAMSPSRSSTDPSPRTTRWASTMPGAAPTRTCSSATTRCSDAISATRTASTARASGSRWRSRRRWGSTPSARSRPTVWTSSRTRAVPASRSTPGFRPSSRSGWGSGWTGPTRTTR